MIEYKKISAAECALRLLELGDTNVLIHVRPDGDAVGTAAALCLILRELGKCAEIMSQDKIPDRLSFILEHAGVSVTDTSDGRDTVAVDVASPAQLGSLIETAPRPSLMIDHHGVGTQFADGYILPEASSAGEVLYGVIKELISHGKLKMTEKLAYALYTAISSDTGCFSYSNAGAETHRIAAELIETGIDAADINRRLFDSKSEGQLKAEGYIASKTMCILCGKVAYATLSISEREALGLSSEDFETAIDIVRSLKGVETAFVIKETDKGVYKTSLRSTGTNVAEIAAGFGGGGHIRAAGCTVKAPDIKTAEEIMISSVEKAIK